jgi:hypothetical protein
LVLNPPRERPIAWSSPDFLCAGTVLMRTHDGAVDHRVFVVRIGREMLEQPRPDAGCSPAAKAAMRILPITEALRQIAPGQARAIAIEHRLDEPPIVLGGDTHVADASRKQVLDPLPLIVAKSIAVHQSAPKMADAL